MKVTITEHGYLSIKAETPLESYALNAWVEKNMRNQEKPEFGPAMILDTSFEAEKTGRADD